MISIISAACLFPSGPSLPLADIASRLQFSLVRKHPLCVDHCGARVKASYFPEIVHELPEVRFWKLTRQVLNELLERQPGLTISAPHRVWVLLPSLSRPGMTAGVASAVKNIIQESTTWDVSSINVLHGGPAEITTALETIAAEEKRKDRVIEVLLAIDSWLPAPSLMWLDKQNLLHNALRRFRDYERPNPYGRVPSEGAAVLVLTSDLQSDAWCVIRGAASAEEDVLYSDEGVCLGKGLIRAAQAAMSAAGNPLLQSVISDVNGEPYRADEMGFALLKLSYRLAEGSTRETPVLASGDLGSAGLLTHLALVAWQLRSSILTGNVLILSSSDDERRGAVVVSKGLREEENGNND
ncbi:hypothetical protein YI52_003760 [Salmonella enterica subsp. enterica serovar Livingstone]|uniref:hypothetical protein n=1 Tax=Salmonella enterica TaxID=28901 RepID=UPI000FB8844A|nr:hypothetical protein [Salmonella enterica]EAB7346789.1 hypothetical protein [Salmonella enterica subsp. enterica serovar Epalinges]EBR9808709.1 hypothetical protein [Salmonella enterica subsp. enterica serovar Teshie]EBZ6301034.1 hypothetical protein [Salmonella enterica subsp. enterica serovar Gombe]ECD4880784.1 hypothetical protein [Salmonella enterica subsp. enterica serovar Coleypark]ECD6621764.1 hypothetical protein [Salmonella enterica subsp. enterica]EDH8284586.1 hypothetical protei